MLQAVGVPMLLVLLAALSSLSCLCDQLTKLCYMLPWLCDQQSELWYAAWCAGM
jgi:hypothetical protein